MMKHSCHVIDPSCVPTKYCQFDTSVFFEKETSSFKTHLTL